ncbi:MAG: DoxX family protein [Halobacteriaceae archaeon]
MAIDTLFAGVTFLLGRLLFGGIIAFMGLNHFLNREDMIGYATHKGIPAPQVAVLGSGFLLVTSGIGIIVGLFEIVAAIGIAGFLIISAITMHDFWNINDPEQQQTEMTQFLKNVALAGGALILLAIGGINWPYAVTLGL